MAGGTVTASALLVMDIQQGILVGYPEDGTYLPRLQGVIEAARAARIPVVYVGVKLRRGYPEVSSRNKLFSGLAATERMAEGTSDVQFHLGVAPQDGDAIVIKRRVSAFSGSDLDVLLRALGTRELILAGVSTSGVVLSTLRQAADLDFGLTVLADCCRDRDVEVHRVLTEKVFPAQATVMTGAEWSSSLA